jgi:hypothetical protein
VKDIRFLGLALIGLRSQLERYQEMVARFLKAYGVNVDNARQGASFAAFEDQVAAVRG